MTNGTARTDEEILSIWRKITDGHGDRNDSHWFMVGYRQAEKSGNKSIKKELVEVKEHLKDESANHYECHILADAVRGLTTGESIEGDIAELKEMKQAQAKLSMIEECYKNLTVWSAVITQVYLKQDVDKIFKYLTTKLQGGVK